MQHYKISHCFNILNWLINILGEYWNLGSLPFVRDIFLCEFMQPQRDFIFYDLLQVRLNAIQCIFHIFALCMIFMSRNRICNHVCFSVHFAGLVDFEYADSKLGRV